MKLDHRIQDLFGIEWPLLQAPMAGANTAVMAIAVSEAGGLGALPCAMLNAGQLRDEVALIRQKTSKPINLNFFCHSLPAHEPLREAAWKKRMAVYYAELQIDPDNVLPQPSRAAFDDDMCDAVTELEPEVVSFHFGLPHEKIISRLKAKNVKILSSATTVAEARWLEAHGCDAVIAQGFEAGGHRGMFLNTDIDTQVGTMALVPQIVDAVKIPVIASGGICDVRGIVAALVLGASGVQLGTAYLFCPEATIAPAHRRALMAAHDDQTVLTNIFSGRAARGIINRLVREVGPMNADVPQFPLASGALAGLRAVSQETGDFISLWSGQAARLGRVLPAGELTRMLAAEVLEKLK